MARNSGVTLETFVRQEALDAVVVSGRRELPPVPGTHYVAFVDPSGGSADSMTLAIGHHEDDAVVLDVVREWRPPFSPDVVVVECAALLKTYDIGGVMGDHFVNSAESRRSWTTLPGCGTGGRGPTGTRRRGHSVRNWPRRCARGDYPLTNADLVTWLAACSILCTSVTGIQRRG